MEREKRNFGGRKPERGQTPSREKRPRREGPREERDSSQRTFSRGFNREQGSYERRGERPKEIKFDRDNSRERPERRSFERRDERGGERNFERRDNFTDRRNERRGEDRFERRGEDRRRDDRGERRFDRRTDDRRGGERFERRDDRGERRDNRFERRSDDRRGDNRYERRGDDRRGGSRFSSPKIVKRENNDDGLIRLNKYISNSGICSRRDADVLIAAGAVTVNGNIVTEMGYKVSPEDIIVYGGERLVNEKKKYLLLNKPKGYITTSDDPQKRKTVMNLIHGACKERIYPVGRLDRNTTGILLFTNDGEMAKKLTHPSFGARKVYHVETDKNVTQADLTRLVEGIELEDGITVVDQAHFVGDGLDKKKIGIEIHSGKNRIVRRLFEYLGYEVVKLDRVVFAGLTKKELPKGTYRFLTEKEVGFLKMLKAVN
ncbi:MAG: pseudouridine synthase [Bacteroidales bacterium]|nr:pseudouridine synthase [Bacteroidales bacterium]